MTETMLPRLEQRVALERLDASQREYDRCTLRARVMASAIDCTATDLRALAKRLDVGAADQRDMERMCDVLLECVEGLSGPGWLSSPSAMVAAKAPAVPFLPPSRRAP